MIIPLNQVTNKMDEIVRRVLRGEIFIYPTDTIAGIGCIGSNQKSVERLFNIKQRDLDKPISYAFADTDHILEYANILMDEIKKNLSFFNVLLFNVSIGSST